MFGFGAPELIIITVIICFAWWVIKRRKKTQLLKLKTQNISVNKPINNSPSVANSPEADSINFLDEKIFEKNDTIIGYKKTLF